MQNAVKDQVAKASELHKICDSNLRRLSTHPLQDAGKVHPASSKLALLYKLTGRAASRALPAGCMQGRSPVLPLLLAGLLDGARLLVAELGEVDEAHDGRVGLGVDHDDVHVHLVSPVQRL